MKDEDEIKNEILAASAGAYEGIAVFFMALGIIFAAVILLVVVIKCC